MTPTTPPAMMGTVFKPDDEGRVRDCVGNFVEDVLEVVVIGADTLEGPRIEPGPSSGESIKKR
jgi:hypothetical protein